MSDTGWLSSDSISEDNSIGTLAWNNPSQGRVEDGNVADQCDDYQARDTYYLKVYDFNAAIPAGASIDGIMVRVKKAISGSAGINVRDHSLKLALAGTPSGNDLADTDTQWPQFEVLEWVEYGNETELWGLTPDDEDINDVNFGVAFSAHLQGGARPGIMGCAWVDDIQVKIFYTEAETGFTQKVMMIQ